MFRRVILLILDGVGVGALPDAAAYGDAAAATLPHVAAAAGGLALPQLQRLGLGRIAPLAGVAAVAAPLGCWGRMAERSPGKDSVTGHWELAGVVLTHPFATFPQGFPPEIIAAFTAVTGLSPLGNIAASGTDILRQLGVQHLQTGRPIIYTSSDSVFQIAAHAAVIAPEELYALCRQAQNILQPHNVCRVIARPFIGTTADNFSRTSGRRDFSSVPPAKTVLEYLSERGLPVCGIGKIKDLYVGRGLTDCWSSENNQQGMAQTLLALDKIKTGLVVTNLVDFDMLYGHRLDASGFASALEDFDRCLPQLCERLRPDDLLLITADHGCDPTTAGSDHSREYVPLLAWSPSFRQGRELGIRDSFADVGATLADNFSTDCGSGRSFLSQLRAASA